MQTESLQCTAEDTSNGLVSTNQASACGFSESKPIAYNASLRLESESSQNQRIECVAGDGSSAAIKLPDVREKGASPVPISSRFTPYSKLVIPPSLLFSGIDGFPYNLDSLRVLHDASEIAKPENSAEVESSVCVSDETLENTSTQEPFGYLSAALESKDICPCSAAAPSLSEISKISESQPLALSTNESSLPSSDTIVPGSSPSVRLNDTHGTGQAHKKCEYGNGCTVQPSFNYPGLMEGMFCGCHRLEGMINVVNKMCEIPGCHKRPSLNYPGVRPAIRCGDHKLPGMIHSFREFDISILSGELKDKAEQLIIQPQKRGDMIKVQRRFITEKIFSEVIHEELSREGQSETHTTTSSNSNTQATPKSTAAITSTSKMDPIIARSFPAPPSTPNLANNSNLANFVYAATGENAPVDVQNPPGSPQSSERTDTGEAAPNTPLTDALCTLQNPSDSPAASAQLPQDGTPSEQAGGGWTQDGVFIPMYSRQEKSLGLLCDKYVFFLYMRTLMFDA
jgi:hypothetical protein